MAKNVIVLILFLNSTNTSFWSPLTVIAFNLLCFDILLFCFFFYIFIHIHIYYLLTLWHICGALKSAQVGKKLISELFLTNVI